MNSITIKVDQGQLNRVYRELGKISSQAPRYIARALNKTAVTFRKEMIQGIQKTYIMKYGNVKGQMKIHKANAGNLVAIIEVNGDVIPITKFKATKGAKKTGAKAQVLRGGGLKPVIVNGIKSYMGTDNNVHHRTSSARGPVPSVMGPSVPGMVNSDRWYPEVEARGSVHLYNYMQQQIAMLVG